MNRMSYTNARREQEAGRRYAVTGEDGGSSYWRTESEAIDRARELRAQGRNSEVRDRVEGVTVS